MNNEETYLEEKVGKGNHFLVPEGYFEQLTANVMQQLPERRKPAVLLTLRPWLYAAACLAAIVLMGVTYHIHEAGSEQELSAKVSAVDSEFIDEAADYALIDNMEIYAYLSEN